MYCQLQFSYTTRYRTQIYHMSNLCECMGLNGEALQLHAVYKKAVFLYYKSHKNPYQSCEYQVLQVTCTAPERAMKLKVRMIKSLSP